MGDFGDVADVLRDERDEARAERDAALARQRQNELSDARAEVARLRAALETLLELCGWDPDRAYMAATIRAVLAETGTSDASDQVHDEQDQDDEDEHTDDGHGEGATR